MNSNIHLNKLQKKALDLALEGKNVFLTGGAGTGKSFVLNVIIKKLKTSGKKVCVAAPTGMAALHIGGVTLHRLFDLPAAICVTDKKQLPIQHASEAIRTMDVLVIDEISMVRLDVFESVICSIRKAENETGKHVQIIVSGDFYQLPPVTRDDDGTKEIFRTIYAGYPSLSEKDPLWFAFMSKYWRECRFEPIILTEILRQDNAEFAENLNRLRTGDRSCLEYFNQAVRPFDPDALTLYKNNLNVKKYNDRKLSELPEPEISCPAQIILSDPNDKLLPSELAGIEMELNLREGARIIFTKNDSYDDRTWTYSEFMDSRKRWLPKRSRDLLYKNGDMGEFRTELFDGLLVIQLDRTGKKIVISESRFDVYKYEMDDNGCLCQVLVGCCIQYPIKLGYAMTIHKAQGCTVDALNVGLGRCDSRVSAGQTYVAFSRVRSIDHLCISRRLSLHDIFVDPDVAAFYEGLGKPVQGRPPKYKKGTVRIRIPKPLLKHVTEECDAGHPIPCSRIPKYKSGLVQKRVPVQIADHVQEEIDEWREKAKAAAAEEKKSRPKKKKRARPGREKRTSDKNMKKRSSESGGDAAERSKEV